jgi:hypothetical protein
MATEVTFQAPWRELGRTDVQFQIKIDGETLGKLDISQGGVDWYPKNARNPTFVTWEKFARLFDDIRNAS